MRFFWWSVALVPLVLLVAIVSAAYDRREQTVVLERLAAKIERTGPIAPQSEAAVRRIIRSIHQSPPLRDEQLATRQRLAIERIEAALSDAVGSVRPKPAETRDISTRDSGAFWGH